MRSEPLNSPRRGATLLEIAVAIGIIGILASLLLPAAQSSRERSRAITCLSNLRQLGTATEAFVDARGRYPLYHTYPLGHPGPFTSESVPAQLLPFLEQAALYNRLDPQSAVDSLPPATDGPNAFALEVSVPVFMCPSDDVPRGGNSYRACFGTTPGIHASWKRGRPRTRPLEEEALWGALIGADRPEDVLDGTSNTVLFSERVVGDNDSSAFTPWADVALAEGDHYRPGDSYALCSALTTVTDHASALGLTWLSRGLAQTRYNHILPPNSRIPDCVGDWNSSRLGQGAVSARSYHPGGVHVVLADGSARFVSQSIELRTWRALGTFDGQEVVGDF